MATVQNMLEDFNDALGEFSLPTDTAEIAKRYRFLNTAIAFAWGRYKWNWNRVTETFPAIKGQSSIELPEDFLFTNRVKIGETLIEEAPSDYIFNGFKDRPFETSGQQVTIEYTTKPPVYSNGDENLVLRIPDIVRQAIVLIAYGYYRKAISDPFNDVQNSLADGNALLQQYESRGTDSNQQLNMKDIRYTMNSSFKYYVSGNDVDGYFINFIQMSGPVRSFRSS